MDEVQIIEITEGHGIATTKGALCFINYKGTLCDGTVFDSTDHHGRPFELVIGSKKIIQGMSLGLLGMKVGGKRKIIIPSSLAYGERSIGKIPPHSKLIFEIELLEARPRE